MSGADPVVHNSDNKVERYHIDIFQHDIVSAHIVVDFTHDQVDHSFVQILILVVCIATGVIIPVLGEEPVQDPSSFPLVFFKK